MTIANRLDTDTMSCGSVTLGTTLTGGRNNE